FTSDDISGGVPERLLRTAFEQGSAPLAGWRLDKDGVRRFARGEVTALHGPRRGSVGLSVVFLPTSVGPRLESSAVERRVLPADEQLDPGTFAQMFGALDERFYELDDDFNFVYVNQVATHPWAKERSALIGRSILEVFPQLQDTELLREHLKVANEGVSVRLSTASPLTGKQVEVSIYPNVTGGVSVLIRDPFERDERGREQLLDERLAEAYAALEIAALEWEPQTGAWQESGTASTVFGLVADGQLGGRQAQLDLVLPADADRYRRVVERAVEQGTGWRTEYRIQRPVDGEVAWLEEHATVLADQVPLRYSI